MFHLNTFAGFLQCLCLLNYKSYRCIIIKGLYLFLLLSSLLVLQSSTLYSFVELTMTWNCTHGSDLLSFLWEVSYHWCFLHSCSHSVESSNQVIIYREYTYMWNMWLMGSSAWYSLWRRTAWWALQTHFRNSQVYILQVRNIWCWNKWLIIENWLIIKAVASCSFCYANREHS